MDKNLDNANILNDEFLTKVAGGALHSMDMKVGEEQGIQLTCNGGTGYVWRVKESTEGSAIVPKPLILLSQPTIKSNSDHNVCGGPVSYMYNVKGNTSGSGNITFELVRPWSSDVIQTETYQVNVEK